MKLWVINRRGEWWQGGLIIAAKTRTRAEELFRLKEGLDPGGIRELNATREGVVYNDAAR